MDKVENEKLITVKENQMPPKKRVYATIENSAVDGYIYRVVPEFSTWQMLVFTLLLIGIIIFLLEYNLFFRSQQGTNRILKETSVLDISYYKKGKITV